MTAVAMSQIEAPRGRPQDVDLRLSEQDFKTIAAILYQDSGIYLPEGKTSLVYSRLAKRLRALGLESFRDYCALISSASGLGERQAMLSALTTNVTRFFREEHHFTDLSRRLKARWADHVKRGGRLRIWSAGCSSGEEAYSIALTILDVIPDAANLDVRVLASDIDPQVVDKGRAGIFSPSCVEPVPAGMRERWIRRLPNGDFSMGDEARELVAFRELNLMAEWPMTGKFQVIFCRNVAIYFDEPTQERLWSRFQPLLTTDGRLYVGHSERVGDKRFESDGLTAYRIAGTPA